MSQPYVAYRLPYTLTTEHARMDLPAIHNFLSTQAYWSPGVPFEVVQRALHNSLPFGIFLEQGGDPYARQVGYARVVSDLATFAYLADVFILPEQRGQGLSKWLLSCILAHPDLQGLRRWMLATRDAHGLYAQFGFNPLAMPERWMERFTPPGQLYPATKPQ